MTERRAQWIRTGLVIAGLSTVMLGGAPTLPPAWLARRQQLRGRRARGLNRSQGNVCDIVETFDRVITCGNGEVVEGRHHTEFGLVTGIRVNGGVYGPEAAVNAKQVDKVELGAHRRSVPGAVGNEDRLGIGAGRTIVGSHFGIDGPDLSTI